MARVSRPIKPGENIAFTPEGDALRISATTPTITKADVGLANVANVAPADLPVSTATQAALADKVSAQQLAAAIAAVPSGGGGGIVAYPHPTWPGVVVLAASAAEDVDPVTTPNNFVFATDAQIAALSTTSPAALRVKAVADVVKAGSYTASQADFTHVDNKIGGMALSATLWHLRTGDDSYLAPLQAFLRATPKPPAAIQALNSFRACFGLFAAVQLLRRRGKWDDSWTLPNHGGITWTDFLLSSGGKRLDQRLLDSGTTQKWKALSDTAGVTALYRTDAKSANNWGAVARGGLTSFYALLIDMEQPVQADLTKLELLHRQYLGDATTGLPNFTVSGDYLASWNNWSGTTSNTIPAGVGRRDTANPALDGVIIDDINRAAGDADNYNPAAVQFGAADAGLTYPFEAWDYIVPALGFFANNGLAVKTWGESGNAVGRVGARFNLPDPAGTTLFTAAESRNTIYSGFRAVTARLGGKPDNAYGSGVAKDGSVGKLSRASCDMDWMIEGTTWGVN